MPMKEKEREKIERNCIEKEERENKLGREKK